MHLKLCCVSKENLLLINIYINPQCLYVKANFVSILQFSLKMLNLWLSNLLVSQIYCDSDV